ncbi:type II toxin-antitoxin system VapC family toxin [Roseomonas mucosa]|uniref:type II toxin-antitoxin system VapC family toxin n=1 Tax=Roseomonas mucosa TaxID=207340 RepID=UPI0028CEABB6|nr:type II toxin-antitoxin system VapC family toxin [Roseomonas mucosa]MDT8316254.1 type II toxin-antitoxin system VapC family toxin [Roseomonas mucosa]MDT8362847.1 type II toxin-antitoxin system VapC family toxin [Roseomonas mucosa]
MKAVVDASIAAKWVIAEEHSEKAATLLGYDVLYAPDHWQAEAVNVIWSKVQFGDLTVEEAEPRVGLLLRAPIVTMPIASLMKHAFTISVGNSVTIYDSLYIAMARHHDVPFVTADARLLRKITDVSLRPLLRWIGDLPAVK